MPSPLTVTGSRVEDASVLQSASPRPSGDVLAGFLAGYRRDWIGPRSIAFVQLWAFDSEPAATGWQAQFAEGVAGRGASSTATDAVPGGIEYAIPGPGSDSYAILAERSKVVMELLAGGPGITQATVEDLARTQYDRLCRS